ncbi:MAG: carbohydrate-binding domain-containing protein [Ruminococcus sp.]|nr:carbohydrate-binding domain-containing protein [Ruminococcus sp.]
MSGSVDDGQIEINTTEKVKLYFNGVSITNYSGPAIQVTNAKRFILVLMEGTTSYLQDVNKDSVNDGVICSNDTVEIKGKGSLNIVAGNAHGISSDDDVVIENGTINITTVKSGIIANDDITINAGTLYIYGGTNGIKSKGTLNINGGYTVVSGGAKEKKSSIYAVSDFIYTGGYVFAAGNTVTAPTQTTYPYVVAGFSTSQVAGSTVSLQLDGYEMISMVPHNNFKCVMMLAPDISIGSTFAVDVNGNWYGNLAVTDLQNIFTLS